MKNLTLFLLSMAVAFNCAAQKISQMIQTNSSAFDSALFESSVLTNSGSTSRVTRSFLGANILSNRVHRGTNTFEGAMLTEKPAFGGEYTHRTLLGSEDANYTNLLAEADGTPLFAEVFRWDESGLMEFRFFDHLAGASVLVYSNNANTLSFNSSGVPWRLGEVQSQTYKSADGTSGASGTSGSLVVKNGLVVTVGATASGTGPTNAISNVTSNGVGRVTSATGLDFKNGTDIFPLVTSNATTTAGIEMTIPNKTGSGGLVGSNAPVITNAMVLAPTVIAPAVTAGTFTKPVLVLPTLSGITAPALVMVNTSTNATNVVIGSGLSLSGNTLSASGGVASTQHVTSTFGSINVSNAGFHFVAAGGGATFEAIDNFLIDAVESGDNSALRFNSPDGINLSISYDAADNRSWVNLVTSGDVANTNRGMLNVTSNLYVGGRSNFLTSLPLIGGQFLLAVNSAGLLGRSSFGAQSLNLFAPENTDKAVSLGAAGSAFSNLVISADAIIGGSLTVSGGVTIGGGSGLLHMINMTNAVHADGSNYVANFDAGNKAHLFPSEANFNWLHGTNMPTNWDTNAPISVRVDLRGKAFDCRLSFPTTWNRVGPATTNNAILASNRIHRLWIEANGPAQTNVDFAIGYGQ